MPAARLRRTVNRVQDLARQQCFVGPGVVRAVCGWVGVCRGGAPSPLERVGPTSQYHAHHARWPSSSTHLAVDDALAALLDLCEHVGREEVVEPCEQLAAGCCVGQLCWRGVGATHIRRRRRTLLLVGLRFVVLEQVGESATRCCQLAACVLLLVPVRRRCRRRHDAWIALEIEREQI